MDKIEYLSDIKIFAELSEAEQTSLARASCRKTLKPGMLVCPEGSRVQFLVIMLSGRASSILVGENGDQVILDFYVPGDIIGEMSLSDDVFYMSNIITIKASEVMFISRQAVLEVIRKDMQLALDLAQVSAERMNHLQARLCSLALENGPQRIITFIRELAEKLGIEEPDGLFIDWNLSHQTIASACGLTRETVSRLIHNLTDKGMLTRERNGWKVCRNNF